jgi:Transposase
LLAASTFNRTGGATMMTDNDGETQRVLGGVDTHKDVHVVAVLDEVGRLVAIASFATTTIGYRQLHRWLCEFGEVLAVGVEDTGSWGAGISRFLRARDAAVAPASGGSPKWAIALPATGAATFPAAMGPAIIRTIFWPQSPSTPTVTGRSRGSVRTTSSPSTR